MFVLVCWDMFVLVCLDARGSVSAPSMTLFFGGGMVIARTYIVVNNRPTWH